MGDNEKKGISFIVPRNVATQFEFMPGIGMKELFFTLGGAGVSLLLFLILRLTPLDGPVSAIISTIPTVFAFMLCRRDPNSNSSVLSLLKALIAFNKKQHKYYYIYKSADKE